MVSKRYTQVAFAQTGRSQKNYIAVLFDEV